MIGYEEIKDIFEDNENINENNYIEMLRNADYETKKNLAYKVITFVFKSSKLN